MKIFVTALAATKTLVDTDKAVEAIKEFNQCRT